MKYSLADYILTIQPMTTDSAFNLIFGNEGSFTIGGNGDDIGSVSASHDDDLWSTVSYATGGYVHNKNLSKVGKVNVSLNQLAPQVAKLIDLCKVWRSNGTENGLTLTLTGLSGNDNKTVFIATDSYIVKEPEQVFGNTAADQDWQFTVGELTFN